jgi:hypothetical protein
VTLTAYAADGTAIARTSFNSTAPPGEPCDITNTSARFLGFQSCGAPITRVVVVAEGYNIVVDTLTFL